MSESCWKQRFDTLSISIEALTSSSSLRCSARFIVKKVSSETTGIDKARETRLLRQGCTDNWRRIYNSSQYLLSVKLGESSLHLLLLSSAGRPSSCCPAPSSG
jgi:hypothetical protein